MKIVTTVQEVRQQVAEWRKQGLTVGLVPTMGYLHEGHASLIDRSVSENDRTVVSDFVNPMQFGPTEDLQTYPRDIDHDAALVEAHGGDLIFHPVSNCYVREVKPIWRECWRILKPGGTVSVTLQSRKGVKKISIPPSAVMQDMHGSCVWVVKKDRTVERRYVVRDVTEGDVQFVASGLKVGETVVADGVHKVNKRSVIEPVK